MDAVLSVLIPLKRVLRLLSQLQRRMPLTNMPLANLLTNLMYRKAGAFGQDAVGAVLRFVIKPAPPVRARLGLSCRRKKQKNRKKGEENFGSRCLSNIWIFFFLVERMLAAARGCYLTVSV